MECKRCGKCCSSFFLALDNIPIDQDEKEIARLASYHGCEPMEYNGKLAIKVPNPCKHLSWDEDGKAVCLIYENRPIVCREYFCQKAIKAGIVDLVKEHGVRI